MSWPIISAPLTGDGLLLQRSDLDLCSSLAQPGKVQIHTPLAPCTPAPGSLGESWPRKIIVAHLFATNTLLEESWWRDPIPPLVG